MKKLLRISQNQLDMTLDRVYIFMSISLALTLSLVSFFAFPTNDDFCLAFDSKSMGILGSTLFYYETWSGRYSAIFLLNLNPLVFDSILGYRLLVFFLLLLFFHSVLLISKLIFSNDRKAVLLLFAFFILFLFVQIPSMNEGIYWLTGSIVYLLPTILVNYFFYFLGTYRFTSKKSYIIYTILIFLIAGTNEIHVAVLLITLGVSSLICFYFKDSFSAKNLIFLILITLIFTSFSVFAPGTFVRFETAGNSGNLGYSLVYSFMYAIQHILLWMPGTLVFYFLLLNLLKNSNFTFENIFIKIHPVVTFATLFLFVWSGFFIGVYSLGAGPPSRTINVMYFSFLIGSVFSLCNLYAYLKNRGFDFFKFDLISKSILFILVVSLFAQKNPVRDMYVQLLSGEIRAYSIESNARLKLLQTSNSQNIILEPYKAKPSTIYFDDIENDANNWKNECFKNYFGKESIKLNDN